MKKNKKKGFTLVELLAVIVVLAIILVIAVPKILDVIKSSRENSLISSVKLIARNAEQKLLTNEVLGESTDTLSCDDVADINTSDYKSCIINVNEETKKVTVTIEGQGKFSGYTCSGTKNSVTCGDSEEEIMVYLSPNWKNIVVTELNNEISASEISNLTQNINPTILYNYDNELNLDKIAYMPPEAYIGQINFYTVKNVPNGITSNSYVDVSLDEDNTIKAYYELNANLYNVYIIGNGIVSFPEDSSNLFAELSDVTNINFNDSIDTSNVTNMAYMFNGCFGLEELDLSSFSTSNVIDMSNMFNNNTNIIELNLASFNTLKVTNMGSMFFGCSSLEELDVSSFDTSKVTNMETMFYLCESLVELDLSSFDTSKVTNMETMFRDCQILQTIYVGPNWTTSGVENYTDSLFQNCTSLVGGSGTICNGAYNGEDIIYAHIDGGTSNPGYFTDINDKN